MHMALPLITMSAARNGCDSPLLILGGRDDGDCDVIELRAWEARPTAMTGSSMSRKGARWIWRSRSS